MDKILVKTPLGEIAKNDKGEFMMTDNQWYDFLEKHGLPDAKNVIKAVNAAKDSAAVDIYRFIGAECASTLADQTLIAGTGRNRHDFTVDVTRTDTVPSKDGEAPKTIVKYGVFGMKHREKLPDALKSNELVELSSNIEKAFEAANKK